MFDPPDARDLAESIAALQRELAGVDVSVLSQEQVRVLADRCASLIVVTGAPAALAVAEAVREDRRRFERGLYIGNGNHNARIGRAPAGYARKSCGLARS